MTEGLIIKAISGFYYVQTQDGILECKARGKFKHDGIIPLVGDRVVISDEKTIDSVILRKNSFIRPAVSNVDALVFVATNTKPITEPFLIDRVSVIAESNHCELIVCINKTDIDSADNLYDIYCKSGFTTVRTSAQTGEGIDVLLSYIKGKISAFTGNSGVGKSSIMNYIFPDANIETNIISDKLGRGKHTTRHVELYRLDNETYIADTPGFASFEIEMMSQLSVAELSHCFIDFNPYLDGCRFNDCKHINEPNCSLKHAVSEGYIQPSRYDSYLKLYDIISNRRNSWD